MEVKIYYQDTDCGGVVYYANYLTYFERARTEFFVEHGISIKSLAEEGILFVVVRAEIDYKAPASYGQILEISTQMKPAGKIKLDFLYRVLEKQSGRLVVTGKTVLVCVDGNLKPRRLPEGILKFKNNL